MTRQLTVDFNEELDGGLLLGNDRNLSPGARVAVGARLTVGDDDAGDCRAEVIDYDSATGLLTLRLLDDRLSMEGAQPAARPR